MIILPCYEQRSWSGNTMLVNDVQGKFAKDMDVNEADRETSTEERRAGLRQVLLELAERTVAAEGLKALKARALAAEANCAVGQIYNVWPDLDALIIAVNARTLDQLDERLAACDAPAGLSPAEAARAVLLAQADAYLDFARRNGARWRAVFEHRLAEERALPEWYRDQQARLFSHVDRPLRSVVPGLSSEERGALGRSIFSAVHGVVWLGLEQLLGAQSHEDLRRQLRLVIGAMVDGLGEGGRAD
jgi:AcrR family transcriptional regulator